MHSFKSSLNRVVFVVCRHLVQEADLNQIEAENVQMKRIINREILALVETQIYKHTKLRFIH